MNFRTLRAPAFMLGLLLSPLCAAACSGQPEHPTTGTSAASLTSGDAVAAVSGTWVFVLDASDPATPVRADCEARSGGDKAKKDACYEAVRAEGSTEKIRFATDPAGHTVWTSFGEKGDKVTLFLEMPVDLSAESPTSVLAKVAGAPTGLQAADAAPHMPVGTIMHLEIVDAQTIAMSDPKKGRLVFKKQ